jgi:hypothetical protein
MRALRAGADGSGITTELVLVTLESDELLGLGC